MRARESQLASDLIPGDLERLFPICTPGASDSASFDEVLELLHLGGRSLPHAVLMMIPEAWENHAEMDPARRAFYEFHSTFMEPWDGPACVTFTDGTADRRRPRPQRPAPRPLLGHRRRPGRAGLRGRRARPRPGRGGPQGPAAARPDVPGRHRARPASSSDDEIKSAAGRRAPVRRVAARRADPPRRTCPSASTSCTPPPRSPAASRPSATPRRSCGSCSRRWPAPAARRSARWAPTRPIAVLSDAPAAALRLLHPALRPGHQPAAGRHPRGAGHLARHDASAPRATLLTATPAHVPPAAAAVPGDRQRRAGQDRPHQRRRRPARLRHRTSSRACTTSTGGGDGAAGAAGGDLRRGVRGDRRRRPVRRPLRPRLRPRPRADPVAAADLRVHHHLIREKTRTQVGLLVEAGDVREVHHVALLDRLRRRRGQPVPGDGVGRGPRPLRRADRRRAGEGGRAT